MSSKKLTTGPFRWTHKINNVNFLSNLQLKNKEESKKGVNTPPSLQDSAHPPVNAGTRLPSQSNNYFRRQHNTKWDVSVLYTCTFTEQKKKIILFMLHKSCFVQSLSNPSLPSLRNLFFVQSPRNFYFSILDKLIPSTHEKIFHSILKSLLIICGNLHSAESHQ